MTLQSPLQRAVAVPQWVVVLVVGLCCVGLGVAGWRLTQRDEPITLAEQREMQIILGWILTATVGVRAAAVFLPTGQAVVAGVGAAAMAMFGGQTLGPAVADRVCSRPQDRVLAGWWALAAIAVGGGVAAADATTLPVLVCSVAVGIAGSGVVYTVASLQ